MTSTARCTRRSRERISSSYESSITQRFLGRNDPALFTNLQQNTNNSRMLESFLSLMEQLHLNHEESQQGLPKEMIDKIKRMKMGRSCQECTVCSEGFKKGEKIRKLPCKHIFHDKCILPWFEHKSTCPNCRFDLLEYYQESS